MNRRLPWFAALSACLMSSCQPKAPTTREPDAWWQNARISTDEGSALGNTCIVSGVERCFDAVDNNCNGVLDEGCGLQTGPLQVEVAWDIADADIDLLVREPSGGLSSGNTSRGPRLHQDRSCPSRSISCFGQNIENVYATGSRLRPGTYVITVNLVREGRNHAPVKATLGIRVGARVTSSTMTLRGKGARRQVLLRVPDDSPQSSPAASSSSPGSENIDAPRLIP